MPPLHSEQIPFYAGTKAAPGKLNGILRCTLNPETGNISAPVVAADVQSPTFLASSPDGSFLYAVIEQDAGAVASFCILEDGSLAPLNTKPSGGKGACHVWADRRHVIVSNYTAGNANCFPRLPDGSLGEATAAVAFSGSGPNPLRQQKPFAHGSLVTPDGRFVYVCDLGTDQIWIFSFDRNSGKLLPADPPSGKAPSGGGPRHLVLGTRGDLLYVNNEMGMSVSVFERNSLTGALRPVQTVPTLPAGAPLEGATTSGLVIHPTGRWLYVSNRGHNSLTVFEIKPDGSLRTVQNIPSAVDMPREFSIDPSGAWLVVGGQKDGVIVSMKIDRTDGTLTPAGRLAADASPVSFLFLP